MSEHQGVERIMVHAGFVLNDVMLEKISELFFI